MIERSTEFISCPASNLVLGGSRKIDEITRSYAKLANLSESLQQKQMQGEEISAEEGQSFETLREEVLKNPAVQDFAEARGTLEEIQSTIMTFVSRTFETGTVPAEKELFNRGGSCGTGCGCH